MHDSTPEKTKRKVHHPPTEVLHFPFVLFGLGVLLPLLSPPQCRYGTWW
ncbi:hypothetical protein I7I48_04708 [Histoplasma ohiense]|nr:hypothetical protein I7I48_04708 [Histoplasma ohiense (nom. inval.)]